MDDKWIKAFTKAVANRNFFFKPGYKTWRGVRMCISDSTMRDVEGNVVMGYFIYVPGIPCVFTYYRSYIWGIELEMCNLETHLMVNLIHHGSIAEP